MNEWTFPLRIILRRGAGRMWLAEPLLIPGISTLDADRGMAIGVVRRLVNEWLEQQPAGDLWRYRAPHESRVETLMLEVPYPRRDASWQENVILQLPLLRWRQTSSMAVASMPTLGIEVVAQSDEDLEGMLRSHALACLLRTGASGSLRRLTMLQQWSTLEVEDDPGSITIKTPKEIAQQEEADSHGRSRDKSTLKQVATDLSAWVFSQRLDLFELDDDAARIAELLTSQPRRSVLLVGPSGVGKTAAVHAMLQQRARLGLGETPFWMTTGSRIVAGMSGFGMWEERCQKLCHEAAELKAVLHVGNLVELMEVGRSALRNQGIASFLRPRIQRGDLTVIAECTPEQLTLIEREEPQLLSALVTLTFAEPNDERTQSIVWQFAESRRMKRTELTHEGLDKLLRLHRRYATYSANPSRPLRFVQSLFSDRRRQAAAASASDPCEISAADVTQAFATETGLPHWLLEESQTLNLEQLRTWFASRVLGQEHAIDLLVNLIATIKAGLTRPNRPLASLLFIGPTGVGKTELAKSLAEFLFSDSQRLTRFDMSEFADPVSVQRLIGGAFGVEGLLTAKIREQPFSVVLFDEVEKADPLFFDLLLQILGEARLTDGAGRVAHFSNAVIVMTSNLGAASYKSSTTGFGNDSTSTEYSQRQAAEHFTREVRRFVRPELFNRLDRIVPFSPLSETHVRQVAKRQLELLRMREGIRFRNVDLRLDDQVIPHLAAIGFDPRFGARPLKRAIERELLTPLAERLNAYDVNQPLRADVHWRNGRIACDVVASRSESVAERTSDRELAESYLTLRRETQRLQQCPAMLELRNSAFQLQRLHDRNVDYQQVSSTPEARERLLELSRLREREYAVDELERRVAATVESLLVEYYSTRGLDATLFRDELALLRKSFDAELLALFMHQHHEPHSATVAVYSEHGALMHWLARAYWEATEATTSRRRLWRLRATRRDERDDSSQIPWEAAAPTEFAWRATDNSDETANATWTLSWRRGVDAGARPVPWLDRQEVDEPAALLSGTGESGTLGLLLELEGTGVAPRWESEAGWHRWKQPNSESVALVEVQPGAIRDYLPPRGIERRGGLGSGEIVRTYDETDGLIHQKTGNRTRPWTRTGLARLLAEMVESELHRTMRRLIDDAD
jgi:ATP-dependent Clp protease ATP-binding subunit ClpC